MPSAVVSAFVRVDPLLVLEVRQAFLEARHVQLHLTGVALAGVELELLLVDEELVVELPELALLLGRDGGEAGPMAFLRMSEGQVLPDPTSRAGACRRDRRP